MGMGDRLKAFRLFADTADENCKLILILLPAFFAAPKRVRLLGYDLFTEPITGGGRLRVSLRWQAQEKMESSYKVFEHLLSLDGEVLAQHDSVPADGEIPTTDWAVGEVISDRHQIEFLGLPAGEYRLEVGMYDSTTGERLPTSEGGTTILLETLAIN